MVTKLTGYDIGHEYGSEKIEDFKFKQRFKRRKENCENIFNFKPNPHMAIPKD